MRSVIWGAIFGIYFFIASAHTLWFFADYKYLCIKKVGFFQGFFLGCEKSELNPLSHARHNPIFQSILKGFIWPYGYFSSDDVNSDLDALAEDLVANLNKNKSKITEGDYFLGARLSSRVITLEYILGNETWELIEKYESKVAEEMFRQGFCENLGVDRENITKMLDAGYQIELNYKTLNEVNSKNVVVEECL